MITNSTFCNCMPALDNCLLLFVLLQSHDLRISYQFLCATQNIIYLQIFFFAQPICFCYTNAFVLLLTQKTADGDTRFNTRWRGRISPPHPSPHPRSHCRHQRCCHHHFYHHQQHHTHRATAQRTLYHQPPRGLLVLRHALGAAPAPIVTLSMRAAARHR